MDTKEKSPANKGEALNSDRNKDNEILINPKAHIEIIIEALLKKVREYELFNSGKADTKTISLIRKTANELNNYLDNIPSLTLFESWLEIEQKIKNTLKKDNQITGFIVMLPVKDKIDLTKISLINYFKEVCDEG